jgi:ATP-dependent Clp protease adapter protein ClpS
LTIKVHDEDQAVVATLPYEMAEQKGIEVTILARNHGFPLQVKVETAK